MRRWRGCPLRGLRWPGLQLPPSPRRWAQRLSLSTRWLSLSRFLSAYFLFLPHSCAANTPIPFCIRADHQMLYVKTPILVSRVHALELSTFEYLWTCGLISDKILHTLKATCFVDHVLLSF